MKHAFVRLSNTERTVLATSAPYQCFFLDYQYSTSRNEREGRVLFDEGIHLLGVSSGRFLWRRYFTGWNAVLLPGRVWKKIGHEEAGDAVHGVSGCICSAPLYLFEIRRLLRRVASDTSQTSRDGSNGRRIRKYAGLPLSTYTRDRRTFRELLRQIRHTALEAYDNSDVPFQRLVSALKPDRRSLRSPIFQVLFGYEPYVPAGGQIFQLNTEPGTCRYDLTLNLAETADGISGAIEYCTDIFDEVDIKKTNSGILDDRSGRTGA